MKNIILLSCFALFPIFLFGQNVPISGQIIEENNKAAIAYANIGILNRNIGTVTDDNGFFKFELSAEVKETDTVKISMIGYDSRIFTVVDFRQMLDQNAVIGLQPKAYNLNTVTIVPKGQIRKIVGNDKRNGIMSVGFGSNKMGREMAALLKIKKQPTYVDKVFVNITQCTYDSIFYRLNIYEYDKKTNQPVRNLLPKPVYVNFTKKETEETLMIDVSHLNILVEDDFIVSLELIKDLGEGDIYFSVNLRKTKGFVRMVSQGEWNKAPIGPSIYAEVLYEE
ncbi:MAG: carboxypeptidase-like regulatory domain-containing protein [Saprospiraceae bacterium]